MLSLGWLNSVMIQLPGFFFFLRCSSSSSLIVVLQFLFGQLLSLQQLFTDWIEEGRERLKNIFPIFVVFTKFQPLYALAFTSEKKYCYSYTFILSRLFSHLCCFYHCLVLFCCFYTLFFFFLVCFSIFVYI